MNKSYKIVHNINGHFIVSEPADIYAWAAAIERKAEALPERRARALRSELRNEPRIEGFAGPMFDGFNAAGGPVIRYEDAAANEVLSR